MSYKRPPTTLIAREGYSDYVAVGSDYMMTPGARLEIGPHGTPYETLGFDFDVLKSIGSGVLGVFTGAAKSEGEAAAYQQMAMQQAAARQQSSGMPSWVLPVAIGGVGLAVVLMLRKK